VYFGYLYHGIFAISTKFAETYLCLKYRNKDKNKKYYGGTMYVLKNIIGNNFLAVFFSISVIIASFGIGCMIQSNSACYNIITNFNIDINTVALIITIISSIIVFSNAYIISKISSIIVPISTFIYITMIIRIIIYI
jgi:alanine or glycine:cation symporter, AGCS family